MTRWLDDQEVLFGPDLSHELTIIGPRSELERLSSCFAEVKEAEYYPQRVVDTMNRGNPRMRPKGQVCFDFEQLIDRPADWDKWSLARWGMPSVAFDTKIDVGSESIQLTWRTDIPTLAVYAELSRLFPRLRMRGRYTGWGIGAEVFAFRGQVTNVDTSEVASAEANAWDAEMVERDRVSSHEDDGQSVQPEHPKWRMLRPEVD